VEWKSLNYVSYNCNGAEKGRGNLREYFSGDGVEHLGMETAGSISVELEPGLWLHVWTSEWGCLFLGDKPTPNRAVS
jgi:hypothetical protein